MLYLDGGADWIDEDTPIDRYPLALCDKLAHEHTRADRRDIGYQLVERQLTLTQVGHVRGAGGSQRAFFTRVPSVANCCEHLVDIRQLIRQCRTRAGQLTNIFRLYWFNGRLHAQCLAAHITATNGLGRSV